MATIEEGAIGGVVVAIEDVEGAMDGVVPDIGETIGALDALGASISPLPLLEAVFATEGVA